MVTDVVSLLILVTGALEELGIRYAIGGSLASSQHGEIRATNDIDVLIELASARITPLVEALQPHFDVWEDSVAEALDRGESFSILHRTWHVKVDFFPHCSSVLDENQMARRRGVRFPGAPDRDIYFTSPEDTVLRKLDWHRRSGGVFERQLRDVEGVLKLQGRSLDLDYMRLTAARVDLTDALDAALDGAGLSAD